MLARKKRAGRTRHPGQALRAPGVLALELLVCACAPEVRSFGSGGAGGSGSANSASGVPGTSGNGTTTSSGGTTANSGGTTTSSGGMTTSASGGDGCNNCGGFGCCGNACVNLDNDIHNCQSCGSACQGLNPFCDHGVCGAPPCNMGTTCVGTQGCCGDKCCKVGELCCSVPGPIGEVLGCSPPSPEGTCPKGCIGCVCASPDTPIATPTGDRPIAELAPGDLVYSVRGQAIEAVPILRVNKVAARDHHVVHVVLDTGAALDISPRHPTADGRTFADLKPGDHLDRALVIDVSLIPYTHPFTHDILPDSNTGTYFARGALIGSTLHGAVDVGRSAAE